MSHPWRVDRTAFFGFAIRSNFLDYYDYLTTRVGEPVPVLQRNRNHQAQVTQLRQLQAAGFDTIDFGTVAEFRKRYDTETLVEVLDASVPLWSLGDPLQEASYTTLFRDEDEHPRLWEIHVGALCFRWTEDHPQPVLVTSDRYLDAPLYCVRYVTDFDGEHRAEGCSFSPQLLDYGFRETVDPKVVAEALFKFMEIESETD